MQIVIVSHSRTVRVTRYNLAISRARGSQELQNDVSYLGLHNRPRKVHARGGGTAQRRKMYVRVL